MVFPFQKISLKRCFLLLLDFFKKERRFKDPFGHFELTYFRGWKHEENILLLDDEYGIWFEKGRSRFAVHVRLNSQGFREFAMKELQSSASATVSKVISTTFRKNKAYRKDYVVEEGGLKLKGRNIIFICNSIIFQLSYIHPINNASDKKQIDRMIKSFKVLK